MKDLPKYYQQITDYANGELNGVDLENFKAALSKDPKLSKDVVLQRVLREAALRKKAKDKVASLRKKAKDNKVSQSILVKENTAKKTAKIRTIRTSWIKTIGIAASIAVLIFAVWWNQEDTALAGLNLANPAAFASSSKTPFFTDGKVAFLKKDYESAASDFKNTLTGLTIPLDSLKVRYALAITYLRTAQSDSLKLETAAMINMKKNLNTQPIWGKAKPYIDWATALNNKIRNGENWKQHLELNFEQGTKKE